MKAARKPAAADFVVRGIPHSAKASRRGDLEVEEPVACWYMPPFHFHATLPGMLRPTLIQDQVIEVRQSCKKRLLAPTRVMKPLHREEFPLDGVVAFR
jgi:hypothetical protein